MPVTHASTHQYKNDGKLTATKASACAGVGERAAAGGGRQATKG